MRIRDLMTRTVAFCGPSDSLARAAQVMWDNDCGAVPIIGPGREVLGMITDRDVCMSALLRGRPVSEIVIGDVMSRPAHVCGPTDSVESAEAIMRENQVRRLPVIDEYGCLIGIVSLADVLQHLSSKATPEHAQPLLVETLVKISTPRKHLN